MADAPRRSPSQHRSWRAQDDAQATSPASRRIQRVAITIAALGLAAALVYVLVPRHKPTTHVAYWPIVQYEVLKAPPLPETVFTPDDLATFERQNLHEATSLLLMQTSDFLRVGADATDDESPLAARLRGISNRAEDSLILYLSAHGVAIDGVPYLMFGDFDPTQRDAGLVELDLLLDEIEQSPAHRKLLILDAGSVVSDPRLGIVVNEFPQLLEERIRERDDGNLWVLASHWLLETSHVSYAQQRSVFSYFVARGLQGEANRVGEEDDEQVDLRELYDYVFLNVSDWVREVRGPTVAQSPALMQGGRGRVRQLDQVPALALLPVPPEQEPPPPAPESVEAEEAPVEEAQRPVSARTPLLASLRRLGTMGGSSTTARPAAYLAQAEPAGRDGEAPAEEAPRQDPAPGEAANEAAENELDELFEPPPPPTPRETVRGLLEDAWKLRDEVAAQSRSHSGGRGAPAEFAPHLWREFQERLLGYELQYRYGASPDYVADGLRENVLPLRDLLSGLNAEAIQRRSLLRPLGEAWDEFRRERGRHVDEGDTTVVEQALALRDDVFQRIPYYVRWYAHASFNSPGSEPRHDDLQRLLIELRDYAGMLEEHQLNPRERLQASELQALRDRLQAAEAQVQRAAPVVGAVEPLGKLESYLSTPLPPAEVRANLFTRLVESHARELEVFDSLQRFARQRSTNPADPIGPGALNEQQWEQMRRVGMLHLELLRCAYPESTVAGEGSAGAARRMEIDAAATVLDEAADAAELDARWDAYRALGRMLRECYRQMPDEIAQMAAQLRDEPRDERDPQRRATRIALERLYRMVDARDASSSAIPSMVPYLTTPESIPVETELAVQLPTVLKLDPQRSTTSLPVVARVESGRPSEAWVLLTYDSTLLEVRDDGSCHHNLSLASPSDLHETRSSFSFLAGRERQQELELVVRALPEARLALRPDRRLTIDVQIYFREGNGEPRGPVGQEVEVRLPVPDVDLLVEGPRETRNVAGEPIEFLRPFPNAANDYVFRLANRSSEDQEVQVEFLAVPARLGQLRPKEWPLDDLGNPRSGVRRRVLLDVRQTVPAGATVPLEFPLPEAESAEAEEGEVPADEPDPLAALPADLSYGVLCLVSDADGRRSVKKLDIEPQRPSDYLTVAVDWDPEREHRVRIEVRPRGNDPSVLPPGGSQVRWHWEGEISPDAAKADAGKIGPPDFQPLILYADVPASRTRPVSIRLDVDDYPRAFLYELPRDSAGRPKRDLHEIRLVSPARHDQAYRAPTDTIPVAFEVDAAADAFALGGLDEDMIELAIVESDGNRPANYQPLRFYADRQRRATLTEVGQGGVATIETQVGDFNVELATQRRSNELVGVLARFLRGRREVQDFRRVLLDASAPAITELGSADAGALRLFEVAQGEAMSVYARVEDRGSVAGVEFFLVPFNFNVEEHWLDDEHLPEPIVGVFETNRWLASIPTDELKQGRYLLLARAIDAVGLRSKATLPVAVEPPPTEDAPAPVPSVSDLAGRVISAGRPVSGIRVSVEGRPAQRTGPDGRFNFRRLPHASYTLRLEGSVRNTLVEKSIDVTVPTAAPLDISLD